MRTSSRRLPSSNRRIVVSIVAVVLIFCFGLGTYIISLPSSPSDRVDGVIEFNSRKSKSQSELVAGRDDADERGGSERSLKMAKLRKDHAEVIHQDNVDGGSARNPVGGAQIQIPSASSTSSRIPPSSPFEVVNGVIIFLHGGRWHSYFVRHALPSLERYFLSCYPRQYPVRIFYEVMSEKEMSDVRLAIPSASEVIFEDISRFWKTLPHGISEQQMNQWVAAMPAFQGRGYRLMCRFWAGLVWQLPSMQQYTYYWRLDTDSILKGPLKVNPFVEMQRKGCEYGFNRLKGENPHTLTRMHETYLRWLKEDPIALASPLGSNKAVQHHMDSLILRGNDKQFWGPMFYNNFELGTIKLKTHPIYQSLFKFFDEQEPYGILRYRWGDAPIHTLGVYAVLEASDDKMCNFSKTDVPYGHAYKKPPPLGPSECLAQL